MAVRVHRDDRRFGVRALDQAQRQRALCDAARCDDGAVHPAAVTPRAAEVPVAASAEAEGVDLWCYEIVDWM